MATQATMNPNTTLMVVQGTGVTTKTVTLNSNAPFPGETEGRILYIKNTVVNPPGDSFVIECLSNVLSIPRFYPNFTTKTINQACACVTLLEYPVNVYNILNYYQATFTDFTNPAGGETVINVSGESSILFVDLNSASKVLVLPTIESLTSSTSQSPYFIIKDVNGNANNNNLYLSTSGTGETIEGSNNALRITTAYSYIEIAGDRQLNRWHILSSS